MHICVINYSSKELLKSILIMIFSTKIPIKGQSCLDSTPHPMTTVTCIFYYFSAIADCYHSSLYLVIYIFALFRFSSSHGVVTGLLRTGMVPLGGLHLRERTPQSALSGRIPACVSTALS